MNVYDTESGEITDVSPAEAAVGMIRYARTLGPGTPACGEYERKALALLDGDSTETVSVSLLPATGRADDRMSLQVTA